MQKSIESESGSVRVRQGPKRKPLEREYPDICERLSPLEVQRPGFCKNNNWDLR